MYLTNTQDGSKFHFTGNRKLQFGIRPLFKSVTDIPPINSQLGQQPSRGNVCVWTCAHRYLLTQTNHFILPSSSKVLSATAYSLVLENQAKFPLILILLILIELECFPGALIQFCNTNSSAVSRCIILKDQRQSG